MAAQIVKAADLADNLDPARRAHLDSDHADRLRRKYEPAWQRLAAALDVDELTLADLRGQHPPEA